MNPGPPILVIKLGALGDFIQALGPFAAIRRHHADSHITLLTAEPFQELAEASPYFDRVMIDARPRAAQVGQWLGLRTLLRSGRFKMVYDLQTSDRSSMYYRLFWPGPRPEWSGIAKGCSHPHANPERDLMHTMERQAEQLKLAGIEETPPPDLSWAWDGDGADVSRFGLEPPYALVVPGGAAHRPAKRWPYRRYLEVVGRLAEAGIKPVLIGAGKEIEVLEAITGKCPQAASLAGETSLLDIARLAHGAVGAIGNDTGPMHICAVAGCKSVVLFSASSDPKLCAQRGPGVVIIRKDKMDDISVDQVWAELGGDLAPPP